MKDEEINEIKIQKDIAFINWNQGFEAGKSQTIQQVRDVLERYLKECKIQLKFNPLSDYWIGKEIGLEQVLLQLDVSLNNNPNINLGDTSSKQSLGESHNLVNTNRQVEGNETTSVSLSPQLGCGKEFYVEIGKHIFLHRCGKEKKLSPYKGKVFLCPDCQGKQDKEKESYACGECGFYTENINQMNEHMKEHKREIKQGEVKNG